MSQKTAWYPGTVKPARSGVYQRLLPIDSLFYSRWDGRRWMLGHGDLRHASTYSSLLSNYQSAPWRGLAEKP